MKGAAGVVLFLFGSVIVYGQKSPMFELLPPSQTGVTFKNSLAESPAANVLTYEYFYNGGGVAIGDINGDGLQDILFTGNMVKNRLFVHANGIGVKPSFESMCAKGA